MHSPRILIIHTGGTFGMKMEENGRYVVEKGYFEKLIGEKTKIDTNCYKILEFENIIDSSDAIVDDFARTARLISEYYDEYEGFLVVTGTDTMCYMASMTHYMLQGIKKPVIFTGAALPVSVDKPGLKNFTRAYKLLSTATPGVYLFFHKYLHRAEYCTKFSSIGVNLFYSHRQMHYKKATASPTLLEDSRENFQLKASDSIGILKIFPSMSLHSITAFIRPYDAVILEGYGCGTFPQMIFPLIKNFSKDKIFVIASQCLKYKIQNVYEASSELYKMEVFVEAKRPTSAVYAKLAVLLGNHGLEETRRILREEAVGLH